MSVYSYNSNHKVITAIIIIGTIALFHFWGKEDAEEELFYDNGQVKFRGGKKNELNHGTWIWYYENGQKMLEGTFVEGKREDLWTQYDTSGAVIMTSMYQENKLHGEMIHYSVSGEPVSVVEYRADTIYKRHQ